ncbi:MAG: hypothetical protein SCG84_03630 [Nitrosomonadaceae bacterium]|nr:hypothetical protein [Nitrosomonadaceae bacterium]MDW7618960.1 hypothetical protein [Nitrosomonadaceae bacterium]MDW7647945.1 hypothetical protein [Nitrosomonadaceae bacterium]MDW7666402.1 hypothetical protein [Nitrosomonadaceae bacterium]
MVTPQEPSPTFIPPHLPSPAFSLRDHELLSKDWLAKGLSAAEAMWATLRVAAKAERAHGQRENRFFMSHGVSPVNEEC